MWTLPRDDRRPFVAVMVALVALAWLTLWLWDVSPYGRVVAHHGPGAFGGGGAPVLLFVAGWTVMVVAMMLPTSLPLITLFRAIVRRRGDRARLVALLIAGYLTIWTLFGLVVYAGGWTLSQLIERSPWLGANTWTLAAATILASGVYQFTPLKYKCLEKCRSPLGFIAGHWRGSHESSRAFRLGAHHGLFCVGCCWSLMLLMFVVGVANLGWMLALGAVMAVEKNMPWGKRISAPLGVALIGWGLILVAIPTLQASGDTPTRIPLFPDDGSGVRGTATFADAPGGLEVEIDVRGLPNPESTYLAHLHPGTCSDVRDRSHGHQSGADEHAGAHHAGAGGIEHPLAPIVADAEGHGSSSTVIEGASVADVFRGAPKIHANVHAEASGAEGLPIAIACGDLREPGR